jgi:hypothetical protein
MTTALEGGEGSASRPGHFLPPGKTRYPLYRRLNRPQGWSGQVRKISSPTGIRSPHRPARSQSLYRLRYRARLGTCWLLKIESKACLLRDLETNKMQDNITLHWPGHALKRKNNMRNNSTEINKNKFKLCGFIFLRFSLEPVGRYW